jgi:hypothetical protein
VRQNTTVEPVDCNSFSFFSKLDVGCLVISVTWLVVFGLAAPGVFLWTAGGKKQARSEG